MLLTRAVLKARIILSPVKEDYVKDHSLAGYVKKATSKSAIRKGHLIYRE